MNRKLLPVSLMILLIMAGGWLVGQTFARAQSGQPAATSTAVGSGFTYQGRLNDGGVPANGPYDFQFGLYDAPDLGSQIGITLTQIITVTDGLFTTALDFGAEAFNGDGRYLAIAVQFSGGGYTTLTPRQALTAVPFASYAEKVQPVENVVTVAKSGGDYTTVSAALAAITSASASNPYLIRIAPGVYTETAGIDLKSYVSLEGSGVGSTIIRGDGSNDSPFAFGSSATVRAGNITAELRHLTVESVTTDSVAIAIRASGATAAFKIVHIAAHASGSDSQTFGIMNYQSSPTMEHVAASAAADSSNSFGVYNYFGSSPLMRHVTAQSTSGTTSAGVRNQADSTPTMVDVHASGTGGTHNYGLETYQSTAALNPTIIRDSTFVGASGSLYNATYAPPGQPLITITSSRLNGAVIGAHACIDSQDIDGQPLDTDCQAITSGAAVTWGDVAGPANVVWVAKSGGDFTSIQAALNSITDATAVNPYLIRVAPGLYEEIVTLKPYIDIEGSGEATTIIRSNNSSNSYFDAPGTLRATEPITAEVRFLTVENYGSIYTYRMAIGLKDAGSQTKLTHVTAIISSTVFQGDSYGIHLANSSALLTHVTAVSEGTQGTLSTGIWVTGTMHTLPARIHDSTATASLAITYNTGIANFNSFVTIDSVQATGTGGYQTEGIFMEGGRTEATHSTFSGLEAASYPYGANVTRSSVLTMTNSTIYASPSPTTINGWGSSAINSTVRLANVSVQGPTTYFYNFGGSWLCRDVYDHDTFADVACP